MTQIYHNPRCSKSRQTLEILKEEGEDLEIIEYLKTPITSNTLKHILSLLGMEPMDLVRTNETIWKELFKGKKFTSDELVTIMVENPKLIERPIVIKNGKARIGRPPISVKKIL